jgi:hypothetical protein
MINLVSFAFSAVLPAVLCIVTLLIVFTQPLLRSCIIGLMYALPLLLCFLKLAQLGCVLLEFRLVLPVQLFNYRRNMRFTLCCQEFLC